MGFPDGWNPVVFWFAPGTEPDQRSARRFNVEMAFVMEPAAFVEYLLGIDENVAAVRLAGVIFDLAYSGVDRGRMILLRALGRDGWNSLPWDQIEPSAIQLKGQLERHELTWDEATKGTVVALDRLFGRKRLQLLDPRYVRRPGRTKGSAPLKPWPPPDEAA